VYWGFVVFIVVIIVVFVVGCFGFVGLLEIVGGFNVAKSMFKLVKDNFLIIVIYGLNLLVNIDNLDGIMSGIEGDLFIFFVNKYGFKLKLVLIIFLLMIFDVQ